MKSTIDNLDFVPEIMVVDDSSDCRILLVDLLQEHGCQVRVADSGERAIKAIQIKQPDIVLLDIKMAKMDGFDVCEYLKENPVTTKIPIIFISASDDSDSKVNGFDVGGADYITKPFDPGEVLSRVKHQLEIAGLNKKLNNMINKLENEKELLNTTLKSIGDGVICYDSDARITMMNEVAMELTGWREKSAIGETFQKVFYIENESVQKSNYDPITEVINTGSVVGLPDSTVLLSKDGIERYISDSMAPIRDYKGNIVGVVQVFRDVTNEKHQIDKIEYISYHDLLTGLYNRRFFEEELRRLDTPRSFPLMLVMGDLNGLKWVNDSFGHAAGDELLKKTAKILKKCFRKEDIICRLGGDEFVILLPGTDVKTAENLVNKIQEKVESTEMKRGSLSISFGWDAKTKDDQAIWDTLKNAEDNMYKMKEMNSQSVRNGETNTLANMAFMRYPPQKRW